MKTRTLGKNLEVSAIGVGCMGFSHATGAPTDIDEAAAVLREAVKMGYTFFDTAMNYGFKDDPCHNEKILGRAFAGMRDQVVISTKTGVTFDYDVDPDQPPLVLDSSPESIRSSLEGSLERLGTDHVDLFLQARIDPEVEPETVAETMGQLIEEGKIGGWGVSEAPLDYLRRAHAVCPMTAVEYYYSITDRSHEDLFGFLEQEHIGWIASTPMGKGLLSGAFGRGATFRRDDWRSRVVNDENLDRYAGVLAYLRELGEAKGATPGQLALAWILAKRPYIVPIPGMRTVERLRENAGAAEVELSAREVEHIDELADEAEHRA